MMIGWCGGIFWLKQNMQNDIVIKYCTAEPAYWQEHVNNILAISASLLLYEEPSAAMIVVDVKYA